MAAAVEETLAREARQAPRAGAAAIAAGIATVAGTILGGLALRDRPSVTLPQGLRDALAPPSTGNGLLERTVLFVDGRLAELTVAQVLTALAAPLMAVALLHLFRATRARNPALGQGALVAVIAGAVATFVGVLVGQIAVDVSVSDFVGQADHSTVAAHDALQPSAAMTAGLIGFLGRVALGLGFLIVSLNAMRVGLLSRFLGVLGILAGVFLAFPFFSVPIVQAFWLVAAGVLLLGRYPNGTPPAWESGRAEPWPTRQQLMEQQAEARGADPAAGTRPRDLPPPGSELSEAPERPQQPRSKKKKRR